MMICRHRPGFPVVQSTCFRPLFERSLLLLAFTYARLSYVAVPQRRRMQPPNRRYVIYVEWSAYISNRAHALWDCRQEIPSQSDPAAMNQCSTFGLSLSVYRQVVIVHARLRYINFARQLFRLRHWSVRATRKRLHSRHCMNGRPPFPLPFFPSPEHRGQCRPSCSSRNRACSPHRTHLSHARSVVVLNGVGPAGVGLGTFELDNDARLRMEDEVIQEVEGEEVLDAEVDASTGGAGVVTL